MTRTEIWAWISRESLRCCDGAVVLDRLVVEVGRKFWELINGGWNGPGLHCFHIYLGHFNTFSADVIFKELGEA